MWGGWAQVQRAGTGSLGRSWDPSPVQGCLWVARPGETVLEAMARRPWGRLGLVHSSRTCRDCLPALRPPGDSQVAAWAPRTWAYVGASGRGMQKGKRGGLTWVGAGGNLWGSWRLMGGRAGGLGTGVGTQDTWEVGQAGRVRDLSIGGGVHGGGDVQLPVSSWS